MEMFHDQDILFKVDDHFLLELLFKKNKKKL